MDIFVEQLVKKQKTGKDYLRIVACLVGVFAALFAMTFGMAIQGIGFIIFVVCCALIYAMYLLITATNMEYEYCFTNGSLDVDKVINRRSRKRMLSLNTRKIEIMATKNNRAFQRRVSRRRICAFWFTSRRAVRERCCSLTRTKKSETVFGVIIRRRCF